MTVTLPEISPEYRALRDRRIDADEYGRLVRELAVASLPELSPAGRDAVAAIERRRSSPRRRIPHLIGHLISAN